MEAVQHFFKTIERGAQQLLIDLPEGVDKAEVEVIVRPMHEETNISVRGDKSERYSIAQKMKGSMSSEYDVDQYDVYDQ
jgi:hypothetical protein